MEDLMNHSIPVLFSSFFPLGQWRSARAHLLQTTMVEWAKMTIMIINDSKLSLYHPTLSDAEQWTQKLPYYMETDQPDDYTIQPKQ